MMDTNLTTVSLPKLKEIDWIEVVLFLTDTDHLKVDMIKQWSERFSNVTIAAKSERCKTVPGGVDWYKIDEGESQSEVWNALIGQATKDWLLFIQDDESIRFSSIPGKDRLGPNKWPPVLIQEINQAGVKQFYQTRLVNSKYASNIFDGRALPDATRFVRENDITFCSNPVVIDRNSSATKHIDIEKELSEKSYPPKLYLVQGERYLKEKKYVKAAAHYRRLLKEKKLLPFDRLGAVNGLASALAEQCKWSNALILAEESLKAEKLQNLPYLIQFRIHELKKEWANAYEALVKYYKYFSIHSRASFDKILDEEKTLINIAHIALKADKRREAAKYFEKLFTIKRGNVDESLLRKVLLLSIELNDFQRSVNIFESLFEHKLPDKLDEADQEELDKIMTLFMEHEWYDYVSEIYNNLHDAHPHNQSYKRKLIVTLTRTNRLDKAKTMLGHMVK